VTPGENKDEVPLPNKDVKEDQDSYLEKELSDEAKEDKDEQKELFSLWISQVETFFTTKFFPAFEYEKVLRDKIKENKKQDAELAEMRKIQAEELERLIAAKEEEEAKRREEALLEMAKLRRQASKKDTSWRKAFSRMALFLKKEGPKRETSPKKSGPEGSRA
ncbi:RS10B protein, partial [Acrocephalus arundinaceus]|nr:RS10B protein [Acrocephalus arundinaceus]